MHATSLKLVKNQSTRFSNFLPKGVTTYITRLITVLWNWHGGDIHSHGSTGVKTGSQGITSPKNFERWWHSKAGKKSQSKEKEELGLVLKWKKFTFVWLGKSFLWPNYEIFLSIFSFSYICHLIILSLKQTIKLEHKL